MLNEQTSSTQKYVKNIKYLGVGFHTDMRLFYEGQSV